jgi:hypothetical protein
MHVCQMPERGADFRDVLPVVMWSRGFVSCPLNIHGWRLGTVYDSMSAVAERIMRGKNHL